MGNERADGETTLRDCLVDSLERALNDSLASNWKLSNATEFKPSEPTTVWKQTFSPSGTIWVEGSAGFLEMLRASSPAESAEPAGGRWPRCIENVMRGFASRVGVPGLECLTGSETDSLEDGLDPIAVEVRRDEKSCRIRIAANAEMLRMRNQQVKPPVTSETPSKTLSVLLDVPLQVTISFGKTTLPLAQVLDLTVGSVIEIDRLVADPVDVLVNGRTMAKAEVVSIGGEYGVRILDLVGRPDLPAGSLPSC